MGDYNLDLLKHEIDPQTSDFLDIIYLSWFLLSFWYGIS